MNKRTFLPKAVLIFTSLVVLSLIWFSALSFVPVPWPDDSAFYFVAHDFFKWPPRWVMLSQAPFEPSYAIHNFNTMPLYPLLLGLGRFVGIDGPWALKLWPLGFFVGSILIFSLHLLRSCGQRGSFILVWLWTVTALLDPSLRWASVLVRPESLIGFCGVCLAIGMTAGWPRRFLPSRFWHPVSGLLAIAAYAHFNAIHLVFPVSILLLTQPRELFRVGALTALYLVPWLLSIAMHPQLFIQQMSVQWLRLSGGNDWLKSPSHAVESLFQQMGSPALLDPVIQVAGVLLWLTIFAAALTFVTLFWRVILQARAGLRQTEAMSGLLFSAAWVLAATALWHNKPEVWFTYYLHLSLFIFLGFALQGLMNSNPHSFLRSPFLSKLFAPKFFQSLNARKFFPKSPEWAVGALLSVYFAIFSYCTVDQWQRLSKDTDSWNWKSYYTYIDCIDRHLTQHQQQLSKQGLSQPYQVWDPTFPDITIELSRRHPSWQFTRTCDFWDRHSLAIKHARVVDALVIPESLSPAENRIDSTQGQYPHIQSAWMTWRGYYLNQIQQEFLADPQYKPTRLLCQVGKWQAFLYLK